MKQKLLKSLLAVAMLCVGVGNVWGAVTETVVVNCDFNNGETLFTGVSRMTVDNDNNARFTCANNSQNGYSLATYNFSSAIGEDATAVKIEFLFWIPNQNAAYRRFFTVGQADLRTGFGKQAYSTAGSMFAFGLARNSSANYFSINGASTTAAASATSVLGAWARAEIYVDHSTKKVNYKITNVENTATYYSADNVAFADGSATYCNQLDFFDCQNSVVSYLDNLVITKYVDESKEATTYTVKYQNAGGDDLKDPVVYDTYVGEIFTASSSDMATFYNGDSSKKYVYASGNTSTAATSTAASNVITLVFNEAARYNYTITSSYSGNTLPWSVSGWCWSDENTFNVRYPRYQACGTTLVGKAPISNNLSVSVTVANDGYSQDLVYSKAADNLLLWSEAENLGTGLTTSATSFTDRVSNSLIIYGASGKIATLLPGTYQVALGVIGHANSGDAATVTYQIMAGDTEKKSFICNTNMLTLGVTDEFTLTETTDITFTCDYYASSRGVDFVYITGTIDDISIETNVTALVKNPDVEEDASTGAWQQSVKGWYNAENVINYRPLGVTDGINTSGAFKNSYAYENWTGNAGGLKGQIKQTIGGLPNGVYKLQLAALVRNVNNQFVYGKSNGNTYKTYLSGDNEQANDYSVIVVVEDHQLEIGLDMNNSGVDWAAIDNARLTYIPAVDLTITSAGWATLYTPYALNFDGTGLTAYTASVEGSTITLNPVTEVPANTGVVLNGAEGSYNVPVITSSTEEQGALTGNAAAATASDAFDGYTLFALAQAEDYPTHQVQFRPVSSGSIAAGKAFLKIASGAGIKAFTVNFGDAVAISDVSSKMEDGQSEIFNLAGQRMSKVQKGVNIVNGKKVLVK